MILILMGVAGSGKTTVGRLLSEALDCPFHDADDFHPEGNREKMSRGQPLTDGDREPWLAALEASIPLWEEKGPLTVLACSALKRAYRERLSRAGKVYWAHLKGEEGLVRERLKGRAGHFAHPGILSAQFHDLEEPEEALVLDIRESPDKIRDRILAKFRS